MGEDGKKTVAERDTTDESLRNERRKTDAELAGSQVAIEDEADEVVASARLKADSVLSDARTLEDRKLSDDGSPAHVVQDLGTARAREDAALTAERGGADTAATDERVRRQIALASLLAYERQDTDLRLEIERMRADEALTSREDFFAMVSHDLRSMLGGIALNATMLSKLAKTDEPVAKVARHADSIQRLCARMNRLIGDLFDVASIEAGKLSIAPEQHDAARLVRDSMEAFTPAAAAQGITLTCEAADDTAVALFDDERILQVLGNLVGNALKFTAEGGRISLRVERRAKDILFAVADSGEGIPADGLDQIFERFYQTRQNDRRGLGLGLYIARCIVDVHGGKIWAESTPGVGSTFYFTLPTVPT